MCFCWRCCSSNQTLPLILCTWEQAWVLLLFDSCCVRVLPSQSTSSPASFLTRCASSPGSWRHIFILLLQIPLTKTTSNLNLFVMYQIKVTFLLFPLEATEKLVPVFFFTCPQRAEFPAPVGTLCLLPFHLSLWTMELWWRDPQSHTSFLIQDLQGIHLDCSIHWDVYLLKISSRKVDKSKPIPSPLSPLGMFCSSPCVVFLESISMTKYFRDGSCFLPSAYLSVLSKIIWKWSPQNEVLRTEEQLNFGNANLMTILIFFPCTVIWCFIIWSWTISQIIQQFFWLN